MPIKFKKTGDQRGALRLLSGSHRNILLYGGSRSGKSFILLYATLYCALNAAGSRHAIVRHRANSIRNSIVNDTLPMVVKLCFPRLRYKFNSTDMCIRFTNGSELWFAGLDSAGRSEKILGREFATIYFNECSEIDYEAVLIAQIRLAQRTSLRTRAYFDCNPPGCSHWTHRLFIEKRDPISLRPLRFPDQYAAMTMNPHGNKDNLPSGYIEETLEGLSHRQRQRFLEGRFLTELDGALWRAAEIEEHRVDYAPVDLEKVVVGVDPAVSGGSASDLTGIVVCARAADGEFYVLADCSVRGTPLEWATRVISAYNQFNADLIVGEVNNGGDLIELALRSVEAEINFKRVTATRGKIIRAEPIAALYQRGCAHHVGEFRELEEQLTSFVPGHFKGSPDRMDALVWALTELLRSSGRERWFVA